MGELDRAAFTIELIGGAANVGDTAITVHRITKTDAFNKVETARAGAGVTTPVAVNIGAAAARIVIDVSPPANGSATFRLTQGAKLFEEPIPGDRTFTYDIKP